MLNVHAWITSTLPIRLLHFLALPLLRLQLPSLIHIRIILNRYLPIIHILHRQDLHLQRHILLYQVPIVRHSVVTQDLILELLQLTHRLPRSRDFTNSQTGMQ